MLNSPKTTIKLRNVDILAAGMTNHEPINEIPGSTRREAAIVFFLFAFIYAFFYHDAWWNGNSRLGLTFAIVQEGRLAIDSFHDQGSLSTGDKSFYNGHYYTDKAIGSSLIAVLFYFPLYYFQQLMHFSLSSDMLKYLLTFTSMGLASALCGALMYILCKQVSGKRLLSFTAVLAISLGTMCFPASVTFFGHQLAGSMLFAAFFLTFQIKNGYWKVGNLVLFLTGFLLGMAVITEYTVVPIALVLAFYYLLTMKQNRQAFSWHAIGLPLLGGLIPVGMLLAYNTAIYENPFTVGYAYMSDPLFQSAHAEGLMGISWPRLKVLYYLTLHPALGLFWQSPVLLFSLAGMWAMARRAGYRAEAWVSLLAFGFLLLINSGHYMWWGGDSFGARHLIPALPFLCLPLVFIPKKGFAAAAIFCFISIVQMIAVVASRMIFAPEVPFTHIEQLGYFEYSSIYSYFIPQLLAGNFSANAGTLLLHLNPWVSLLLPISAILAAGVYFAFKQESGRVRPLLEHQESSRPG